jgi:iron complex transport system ATP-binding protein
MKRSTALHTQDLTVGYGKGKGRNQVISRINVEAQTGQIISLIGANGTGKSTLLRSLAGLQPILDGEILIESNNFRSLTASQIATKISIVLTDRVQTGYFTVGDLVALGRHPYTDWRGRMNKEDIKSVKEALAITGLSLMAGNDLATLSDGQKQKALIARAIAQDGAILLLDEPLIHLDIPSKWEIFHLLKRMAHEKSKTVILATHELDLSLRMADQLWLIDDNHAMVTGAPEDLVLEGSISKAFNSLQYTFDQDLGGFTKKSIGIKIQVTGAGNTLVWTKRALERAGYAPVDDPVGTEILCESSDDGHRWKINIDGQTLKCTSIEKLLDSLKRTVHS